MPKPLPPRGAFDRSQAAHYLSISTRFLDNLVSRGKIRKVKAESKTLFRKIDLDFYLEEHLVGGEANE